MSKRYLLLHAGNSLTYHAGQKFSTMDKDSKHRCAYRVTSAWWYGYNRKRCVHSNLTGLYLFGKNTEPWKSVMWYYWKSHSYSLKFAEMKIRPYHIWTSRHLVFVSVTDMRTLTWRNWNNKTIMIAACEELLLICLTTSNIRWFIVVSEVDYRTKSQPRTKHIPSISHEYCAKCAAITLIISVLSKRIWILMLWN